MGYQRGPYKRHGHGLCCASRKCVFTTKHRRASPVRATESAASPLCCSGKGGGGRPTPLSNIPPPRLSDIPRTRTPRTLPTAVCAGHPVAVETRAAPAKANPHTSISSHLAATTALNDPPGRTRPGQVSAPPSPSAMGSPETSFDDILKAAQVRPPAPRSPSAHPARRPKRSSCRWKNPTAPPGSVLCRPFLRGSPGRAVGGPTWGSAVRCGLQAMSRQRSPALLPGTSPPHKRPRGENPLFLCGETLGDTLFPTL